MKRISILIICVVGISLVLIAGLWVFRNRPANQVLEPNRSSPIDVKLCDLRQNADLYKHQTVRIKTIIIGFHDLVLFDPSCELAAKDVKPNLNTNARRQLVTAIDSLRGSTFQHGNIWASATLIGRLEENPSHAEEERVKDLQRKETHRPRLLFAVSSVEHVEPVSPEIQFPTIQ